MQNRKVKVSGNRGVRKIGQHTVSVELNLVYHHVRENIKQNYLMKTKMFWKIKIVTLH